ncbi:MAG: carboxymuconolactone decarboxylase family protein [Myxococcales bacterium]|nr:carboxymuconolactone decarboxylase family protein [Myxococcales bacterium]
MRLSEPRIPPLPSEDVPDEVRKYTGSKPGQPVLNIYRTLARYPKLAKRWLVFGAHILAKNTLSPRERELLILRTGWRCRSGYEWGQHVRIGLSSGLTEDDIERIKAGPEAEGIDPFDATLLRAADELHDDQFISDATWKALGERYDERQVLDLIFTVGQYTLVSMALNSLGIQLEDGTRGF